MDPPRLRSRSGSLESILLRSAPSFEPPPSAEEEVWRRLKPLTAVGIAAAATSVGSHAAAAGTKLAGKALWLAVIKWGAVIAVAAPAVGVTTHWALQRRAAAAKATVQAAQPAIAAPSVQKNASTPGEAPSAMESPPVVVAEMTAPQDAPKAAASPHAQHAAHAARAVRHAEEASETPSALQAESRLLASARAKFAGGDPQGALDDIARLSARFPRGKLAQEREVVAIDCLAALGNRDAMHSRALAFLQRFPNGPYAAYVRQMMDK
jgi:hypothetical protein